MSGIILFVLSFLTYPIIVPVLPEQASVFVGNIATDLFYWFRSLLILSCIPLALWSDGFRFSRFLPLVLLIVVSTGFSPFLGTAILGSPNYYEGAFVLLGYLALASQTHFPEKWVRAAVFMAGAFAAIQFAFGNYFSVPPVSWLMPPDAVFSGTRLPLASTFGNPNHLGLFSALLFPYFIQKKDWLTTIVLLALLLGSQSKGALFAVWVVLLFENKIFFLVGCILLALFAGEIHLPLQPTDLHNRAFIWGHTLPLLKSHWLWGSGPGVFALQFPQGLPKAVEIFGNAIIDRPHNIYLQVWHATGLLSLVCWGLIVVAFFRKCKDNAKRMGVMGFLVAGLFTDSVVSVTPYFLVMLGSGL